MQSIIQEVEDAVSDGYVEITLLGQNVNSYRTKEGAFTKLIDSVASVKNVKRVRYTSPHPQDMNDELLKKFVDNVNPDVVSIDYNVNPKNILDTIQIPIQGGLDPKVLLLDKNNVKKEAQKYLDIFKDHPYIFNLGHGVLPETNPDMVNYLVNIVKNFK